ncbi:MAG TPA: DUF5700 domain-containing putative Zn-dependent protease [Bacillota bacterium]|nr:DUF5700 domain-containing putative Zn-dependent protease [Bacillota bacterium]
MKFDFSAVEVFQAYLQGSSSAEEVLAHPAYRAVCEHASHFGGVTISPRNIEQGLQGLPSPFYGLSSVRENLPDICRLKTFLGAVAAAWAATAAEELRSLLPGADTDSIVVYPIIGYDAGIGLSGNVCMSLNYKPYHETPDEFLSTMIHEGFHVLYERMHGRARIHGLTSRRQWREVCLSMLQNEGLAVYAPYAMRQRLGYGVRRNNPMQLDYAYLTGDLDIDPLTKKLCLALDLLDREDVSDNERLEAIFGPERLTYRVGSVLARRIDEGMGSGELAQAITIPPGKYWQSYAHLL